MKLLTNIKNYLEGKKTYIFVTLSVVQELWTYCVQHGSNLHTLVTYLLFGGGLAALRAAISKAKQA